MFCYQCEQTAGGVACQHHAGVCGKSNEVATLQDALRHIAALISQKTLKAPESLLTSPGSGKGVTLGEQASQFVVDALFTTITNVNFSADQLNKILSEGVALLKTLGDTDSYPAAPAKWLEFGEQHSIPKRRERWGNSLAGVMEIAISGLKGAAAYTHHAGVLNYRDNALYKRFLEKLSWLTFTEQPKLDEALAQTLDVGDINLQAMELLDKAQNQVFGAPQPTPVAIIPKPGKCILISGHDLDDLRELLRQTEGKNISVYTHGEMLPAHGYPELHKFSHLVGNYGGAWQDQRREFSEFPGAILMTTNCIQQPTNDYINRIFTSGLVSYPNVTHVHKRDFSQVIAAALAAPGFPSDVASRPEYKTAPATVTVGFGHAAVMGVADKVIAAVKAGQIRHFFLIGGCDGARSGRNYYTEIAEKIPQDCMILTLACGKYRFIKHDYGTVAGLPRLLDIGQCNDAYSAIQIALALSKAFGVGVNELPLSLILSWYEQKAVAILLTLLHLGIRNIRLGPSLPAALTPEALAVLVEKFAIRPISTPDQDLADILK